MSTLSTFQGPRIVDLGYGFVELNTPRESRQLSTGHSFTSIAHHAKKRKKKKKKKKLHPLHSEGKKKEKKKETKLHPSILREELVGEKNKM